MPFAPSTTASGPKKHTFNGDVNTAMIDTYVLHRGGRGVQSPGDLV
jgi:hypothetical protein